MTKPIIEVEALSKKYHLGSIGATTLRDDLQRVWHRMRGKTQVEQGEFWALRDLCFSVEPGETLGVVGRNGAGKSTLLKILSRITEPTSGRAILRGRVSSLLEVGTGFHPDLSGRDNIFLNGAILGMRTAEIRQQFDDIVSFAEIGKFIDTPVKHYSSGMQMRLAFAVGAYLNSDILIIDEVLAVGDAQFQNKCLGKINDVTGSGRTVLFVSHNTHALRRLCKSGIFLEGGRITDQGSIGAVLAKYSANNSTGTHWKRQQDKTLPQHACITEVRVEASRRKASITLAMHTAIAQDVALEFTLYDQNEIACGFGSLGFFDSAQMLALSPGSQQLSFSLDTSLLAEGTYSLQFDLSKPMAYHIDRCPTRVNLEVVNDFGTERPFRLSESRGAIQLKPDSINLQPA